MKFDIAFTSKEITREPEGKASTEMNDTRLHCVATVSFFLSSAF